ncbi:protein kinase [Streptomyces sp. R11]|uniref:Protein kinase n=1 Tax=Streptomyces sp. R11 TaxID=3238625 RepID=A0AB39N0A4_9ACTN
MTIDEPLRINALLVGVSGPGLSGAQEDVASIETVITGAAPEVEIKHLTEDDAKIPAINRNIRSLSENISGLNLFYFSGHGTKTRAEIFLETWDGEPGNEGIPLYLLVREMSTATGAWLAILDCCHSTPKVLFGRDDLRAEIETALAQYGGSRAVLAACGPQGEALELGGQSPFTEAIVQGLRGSAANARGAVTLGALYEYVEADLKSHELPRPVLRGDLADSFIIGVGLPPRGTEPLHTESKEKLLEEATRYASALRSHLTVPASKWKQEGWLAAERGLKPIARWFKRQSSEHGELLGEEAFIQARTEVKQAVAQLARVYSGVRTPHGTIGEQIGKGGFGTVWTLTTEEESTASRAIKIYHADEIAEMGKSVENSKVQRFHRGFRAMEQLKHDGIVHVVTYTEIPPAIIMELIDGMNLRTHLREYGTFGPVEERIRILSSISDILQYAHSQGIVHRDIKPENVLLAQRDGAFVPVLTDFDLAWFPTATELTGDAVIGHKEYAAPEQINVADTGRARDERVDVYAFGQLLYFLLTEADPKQRNTLGNVRYMADKLSRDGISEGARASIVEIYSTATHMEKKARFGHMWEISKRLRELSLEREEGSASISFRTFCGQVCARAKIKVLDMPEAWKVMGESSTGRTTVEMISRCDREAPQPCVVQARFKVFDLPGQVVARNSHVAKKKANMRRVEAMEAADPEVSSVVIGKGYRLAELRTEVPELSLTEAEKLGRRMQAVVSAGERV